MTAPSKQVDFDTRVAQFVKVRDKIKDIQDRQKEELKPFKDLLEKLNEVLLGHLNEVGANNVGTTSGTVYRTSKKTVSIADMTAFWGFVMAQEAFDMVDKRANSIAVEEYLKETGHLPPGVNWSVHDVVGVRRK